ncbi:xanthine dehydrogenase small subunit [Aquipseudomonas ullengensis]|uniref:Xanthine dehydrogenase small subunit n=1 Tax=Aquipseudomonas ullengensis TaxID=2759166 RepID=A0A7W4LQ53_9GAMM|nr:xanthine dehydrogenase small subunit [Pseudomonas ullengensis]MBB2497262.1 xanthine dehydrogenase small subunit [Pseudomonas ullengensis]
MLRFLLNQSLCEERDLDPNLTVLDYLRQVRGRTGTKEGCASGDCGACTVVLVELHGQGLRYRAINACLTFIASLHGKQLLSVEDLKQQGRLHQVQQAMADCHGSQCGFCTPGFVMSLFALQKGVQQYDPHATHQALSGNLCRCTGYRPILAAAEQACSQRQPDSFDAGEAEVIARLRAIAAQPGDELQHNGHRCLLPTSSDELASQFVAHPEARLVAGGTDLALEITQFHRELPLLIHVGHIQELKHIEVLGDCIEIGAGAALSDCHAMLAAEYPDFGALLERFASLQIRNQGTLGGNIGNASPIGDAPPLLIALGATLVLRQGEQRRSLPLEAFFLDYKVTARQPGEFIEKVIVPRAIASQQFRAYKVSKRLDDDISAVCAAFSLQLENGSLGDVRIAFGGMAGIPKRATACEQALHGQPFDSATVEAACAALAQDFNPLSDFRASREYRLLVAQNLLRRCHLELTQPHIATRVTDHA